MSIILDFGNEAQQSVSTAEHKLTCHTYSVLFSIRVTCSLYLSCVAGSLRKLPCSIDEMIDDVLVRRCALLECPFMFLGAGVELHVSLTTSRPLTNAE